MPHPSCPGFAPLQHQVDLGRDQHPPQGGGDGQNSLPQILEFAHDEFPFDLQADDEKENGHQSVIDPVLQGVVHLEATQADGETGLPDPQEPIGRWQIRQRQGDGRGHQEDDATGGFDVQEAFQGIDQAVDGFAGQKAFGCVVGLGHNDAFLFFSRFYGVKSLFPKH